MKEEEICYYPDCKLKATFKCPDCGRKVCEIHTRGKYCFNCTREGDDIDMESKEAKEMAEKLTLFNKELEKEKIKLDEEAKETFLKELGIEEIEESEIEGFINLSDETIEIDGLRHKIEKAKVEGRFDEVEKYTKEIILKLIDGFNDAQLMAISYDVLKAVYTEKDMFKTFKADGIERTNKEILVELMYAYGVGVIEKIAYSVDKEFFKNLGKDK